MAARLTVSSCTASQQSRSSRQPEGPKRFDCPQCPATFQTKWNTVKHVKVVHLKERLHRCDICQRTFGARNNLKRHNEDVHLKIRKHHCTICAQSFGQRATLKRHLSLKHKFEVDGDSYWSKGIVAVERKSSLTDEGTYSMPSNGHSSVIGESRTQANDTNTRNSNDISPAFQGDPSSFVQFGATDGMSISESGGSRIGYPGHAAAQDQEVNSVTRLDVEAAVELFLRNPYSLQ